MAIGVATPTIPVANDIILGEFNVYLNYNLPTELLLGATRGGCKVDIERNIHTIKADGLYGPQLDTNGVPLVRYDTLIGRIKIEQLYLKYFNRKIISDCESDGAWASKDWDDTGGAYTAETTIVNSGDQSAKCTAGTTVHGIHEVFTADKDLTVFDNAETSTTSDYIGFSIYITTAELADLGTSDIRIIFHNDAFSTLTNYKYYDVEASALNADEWTSFKVLKSAFSTTGSGLWTGVKGVSVVLNGAPSAETVFYIDSIELIQAQTNSAIVGLNGANFDYTNETTYRLIKPDLELTKDDYIENVTLVGQRLDGKKVKIVLLNALNDGNIDLALEEKNELVNSAEFVGHYKAGAGTTCPIELFEYVS